MNHIVRVLGFVFVTAYLPAWQSAASAPDDHGADTKEPSSTAGPAYDTSTSTQAIELDRWHDLAKIIPKLAQQRVVFVGEDHTRLDHHLNQLAIIRHLYDAHPNLAIGVEYFQQPYQHDLDEFIAGNIDATDLLLRTQYYRRWGYDFRLYAPIFQFAREHHIPVIALNVPTEVIDRVSEVGIAGLNPQQRATLPEHIDDSNSFYRERLEEVYQEHPTVKGADFDKFYDVQLAWDEGMAARAAQYLQQHPDRPMVVLAGQGHVAYGDGIPDRVQRRLAVQDAIVLNDWQGPTNPNLANYLLTSHPQELPPAGVLGVLLVDDAEASGGARVDSFAQNSAAKAAGMEPGDRIVALNGDPVDNIGEVKARLWNKKAGEQVLVKVRRESLFHSDDELSFAVTLR